MLWVITFIILLVVHSLLSMNIWNWLGVVIGLGLLFACFSN